MTCLKAAQGVMLEGNVVGEGVARDNIVLGIMARGDVLGGGVVRGGGQGQT